jgi:glycine dehydrogenase subunit 1
MTYTYNTADDQRAMLKAIGVENLAQLFEQVPPQIRLGRDLDLPPRMGELELTQHMVQLAGRNLVADQAVCFLGAGSYDHFVPAVVDALASRGEFYTSYTPYQPEVSQGNLQVMFEYQTLICQLTGMDVSNASLYDGGSAVAEAALMSISVTRRDQKVVVPASLHPEHRQILETYLANIGTHLHVVPCPEGHVSDLDGFAAAVDAQTACVVVQHPNFFGNLEQLSALAGIAHAQGALLVVVFDPISLGLLKRPGDLGADIVVAEGQCLGTPLSYGGPYLGIMACRERFVRRMPGRIAGETVDRRGRRCWVLTLQTREQHIRRDKATSNICTNQGLFALRASIYLSAMGPRGLRSVAHLCLRKSHYAAKRLCEHDRFRQAFEVPFFKEFVIRDQAGQVRHLLREATESGYLAGVPLGRWYPELDDCFLVAVTEQRTRAQIDGWAGCLAQQITMERARHA